MCLSPTFLWGVKVLVRRTRNRSGNLSFSNQKFLMGARWIEEVVESVQRWLATWGEKEKVWLAACGEGEWDIGC